MVIRLVDAYGFVHHQTNFYRVPGEHIGELLYLCADLERLEVFDRGIHRLAEHERLADGAGLRRGAADPRRRRYDLTLLLEHLVSGAVQRGLTTLTASAPPLVNCPTSGPNLRAV